MIAMTFADILRRRDVFAMLRGVLAPQHLKSAPCGRAFRLLSLALSVTEAAWQRKARETVRCRY